MKDRYLKIQEAPGVKRDIPRILLQEQWLSTLDYNVDGHIIVS